MLYGQETRKMTRNGEKETQKKRGKDLTLEMKTVTFEIKATHKLLKTQVQKIVSIKIYSNISMHIQNKMYRENNTNHIQIQIVYAIQAFSNNIARTHKAKRVLESNI